MDKKLIETKVKIYVLTELTNAQNYPKDAFGARQRAYGVVFFASNNLFSEYNKELANWWDDDILPMFNSIIRKGY